VSHPKWSPLANQLGPAREESMVNRQMRADEGR